MMRVFIMDACRTPIGKTGGTLMKYSETDLLAFTFRSLLDRNPECKRIEDVIVGCCFTQEPRNLAKKAVVQSNMLFSTPAMTINRTCASSLEALMQGVYRIRNGNVDRILVGGTENMNSNPHVMKSSIQNVRKYIKQGMPFMPETLTDEELIDEIGISVDMRARELKIGRTQQDEYAAYSHYKAEEAWNKGEFNDETIRIPSSVSSEYVCKDEGIETTRTTEHYQNAQPLFFRDGQITKYNASSISDGAAAALLVSEREVVEYDLKPIAEVILSSVIGASPCNMIDIAADAYLSVLEYSGLSDKHIDLIECNEAYAAQAIACINKAGWSENKVNIYGGSLALGHPLGCTGLRICTTLIYGMRRRGVQYGAAVMCAGGGMGYAVIFKLYEGI